MHYVRLNINLMQITVSNKFTIMLVQHYELHPMCKLMFGHAITGQLSYHAWNIRHSVYYV